MKLVKIFRACCIISIIEVAVLSVIMAYSYIFIFPAREIDVLSVSMNFIFFSSYFLFDFAGLSLVKKIKNSGPVYNIKLRRFKLLWLLMLIIHILVSYFFLDAISVMLKALKQAGLSMSLKSLGVYIFCLCPAVNFVVTIIQLALGPVILKQIKIKTVQEDPAITSIGS